MDPKIQNNMLRRVKLKSRLKQVCHYCECTNPLFLTVDHKLPKSRGGFVDDPKNVVMCCWLCNQLKGSLTVEEFKVYLNGLFNLYELYKVKVVWPERLVLEFKQDHFPLCEVKGETEKGGCIDGFK